MQSHQDLMSRSGLTSSVEHEETSGAQLERYESGESAPGSRRREKDSARAGGLHRDDDEEVATKPWPPLDS